MLRRFCLFPLPVSRKSTKRFIFNTSAQSCVTKLNGVFKTDLGQELNNIEIKWEQWGSPKNKKVVLLCPSLSVGCHARSTVEDPTHGWWENVIGPGKGIDTGEFRVICASNLGAPFGSTSPLSIDPLTNKPFGPNFPQLTPKDVANASLKLLDELKVEKLYAVVGASFGGCVALHVAAERPNFTERLLAISCTAKASSGSAALRHVQRDAVRMDPNYKNGNYIYEMENSTENNKIDVRPLNGLRLARQLGMITYRSLQEFTERFIENPQPPFRFSDTLSFEVEKYLRKKADLFAKNYDANCFLLLSLCSDLMNLGRHFASFSRGIDRIDAKSLIIGVENDMIIAFSEQQELFSVLKSLGKDTRLIKYSSIYGHDAFFVDERFFIPTIREFLSGHVLKQ